MKGPGNQSCCGNARMRGGVAASDFAAPDALCLDSGFAAPLRQVGWTLERIAVEQGHVWKKRHALGLVIHSANSLFSEAKH